MKEMAACCYSESVIPRVSEQDCRSLIIYSDLYVLCVSGRDEHRITDLSAVVLFISYWVFTLFVLLIKKIIVSLSLFQSFRWSQCLVLLTPD